MNYSPEKYGKDVLSGKIPACLYVRLYCARHFEDLKRQKTKDFPFYFDHEAGIAPIKFFKLLRHYKGRWAGQSFEPAPWQAFNLYLFFGWKRLNGKRKYKYCYIEVPKKNGKSTYVAAKGLYHMLADGEGSPEVYIAASKEAQARICLDTARFIGKRTPIVSKRLTIRKFDIEKDDDGGVMRALGSDSKKQDGLNVSHGIIDEYHTHQYDDMYDILKQGCGAREQPMIDIITTAGYEKNYPCYKFRRRCINVLEGSIKQENLLAVIYTIDKEDDWTSEDSWRKANPSWDIINQTDFRDEAEMARTDLHEQPKFKTKRLCVWADAEETWISDEDWMKCAGPKMNHDQLKHIPCYGGLDLANVRDVNALVLNFPLSNGTRHIKCWFWIPYDKVRSKEDIVDYWEWKEMGLINVVGGNSIDQDELVESLLEILGEYNLQSLAYDRWGSDRVVQGLQKGGIPDSHLDEYKQTVIDMTKPVREIERSIMSQQLNHEGNLVLKWMASNVVIDQRSDESMKFDKKKAIDKIDGMVALAMSIGAEMTGPAPSAYRDRGVRTV